MSNRNAFAIHSVKTLDANGNAIGIPASTEGKPSVFPIDAETFDTLERLGAVRQATREEIAVAKDLADRDEDRPRVTVEDTTTTLVQRDRAVESTAQTKAPQPGRRPKGAAKDAEAKKEGGSSEGGSDGKGDGEGENSSENESSNDDMGV